MSISLVYGLAGLGSVEESKLYREKVLDETTRKDSLAEETERALLGKSKEDGKLNHIYKGASAVRKILVPSHTEVTPEERMAAHLSNASKVYHEFSGNPDPFHNDFQNYRTINFLVESN